VTAATAVAVIVVVIAVVMLVLMTAATITVGVRMFMCMCMCMCHSSILLCVIGIFTACCLIEWVRRWLFKACRISALLDRISDQLPRHVLVKLEAWEEKRLSL